VSFFTQTGTPAACVSVRGNIGGETIYCDVTAAPLGWIKSRAVSWPSLRVMRSAADLASLAEIFEGDLDTLRGDRPWARCCFICCLLRTPLWFGASSGLETPP
jgi:hypothetical protein